MKMKLILIGVIFLVGLLESVSGTTWYVVLNAAQSGDGTSPDTAFKTVPEGIRAAENGDTVMFWEHRHPGEPRWLQIAVNSTREVVAVWDEPIGCDYQIFAQQYDANGNPRGEELWVSQTDLQYNRGPSVDIDNRGRFVVTWISTDDYGYDWKVYFRLYDPSGNPSEVFQAAGVDKPNHLALNPTITMATSGKFVIGWLDCRAIDEPCCAIADVNIYCQQFHPNGEPMCGAYQINDEPLDCFDSATKLYATKGMLVGITTTEQTISITYKTSYGKIPKTVTDYWRDVKPLVTIGYQQKSNPGEVVSLTIFPTVPGKKYQVYYCDALGDSCWLPFGESIIASDRELVVTDNSVSSETSRFYRVTLVP